MAKRRRAQGTLGVGVASGVLPPCFFFSSPLHLGVCGGPALLPRGMRLGPAAGRGPVLNPAKGAGGPGGGHAYVRAVAARRASRQCACLVVK